MNPCPYCGRQNADEAPHCEECGTPLAQRDVAPDENEPVREEQRLNGHWATVILLIYLVVQMLVAAFVIVIGVNMAGNKIATRRQQTDFTPIMSVAAVLGFGIGGGVMFLLSRAWIGRHLSDRSPTGAAWVVGSPKHIAYGLCAGILSGCSYWGLALIFARHHPQATHGYLARMAMTPGLQQMLWVVLALGLAPFIEELLFRGVVYGGFRASWGPVRAGILTTAIFWALHLTETIHFPAAMVSVAAVALVALWFRLRSAAIGPAVAVHFGYNAILAAVAVLANWR